MGRSFQKYSYKLMLSFLERIHGFLRLELLYNTQLVAPLLLVLKHLLSLQREKSYSCTPSGVVEPEPGSYLLFSIYLLGLIVWFLKEKTGGQIGVKEKSQPKLSTDITFKNYFSVPCTINQYTRPFLYAQIVPMGHHIPRPGPLTSQNPPILGRSIEQKIIFLDNILLLSITALIVMANRVNLIFQL